MLEASGKYEPYPSAAEFWQMEIKPPAHLLREVESEKVAWHLVSVRLPNITAGVNSPVPYCWPPRGRARAPRHACESKPKGRHPRDKAWGQGGSEGPP